MSGVCFVDCETTGLDPDRHEIWNVGLILPDGSEREWFLRINLARADLIALNIGHFSERHPWGREMVRKPMADRPKTTSADAFAEEFMYLTWGFHLAGAVVSFDAERLARLLRTTGRIGGWHYHLIDVEALAAGWVSSQCESEALDGTRGTVRVERPDGTNNHIDGRPPWKSDDLSRAVGVNPDDFDRHTALGDARWARSIYRAVMGET